MSAPCLIVESGVWHDRIGCPSTCTVHAPQSAIPQPNLVPVRFRLSRRIHSSGVSGGTSALMSTRSLLTNRIGIELLQEEITRRECGRSLMVGECGGGCQIRASRMTAATARSPRKSPHKHKDLDSIARYNQRLFSKLGRTPNGSRTAESPREQARRSRGSHGAASEVSLTSTSSASACSPSRRSSKIRRSGTINSARRTLARRRSSSTTSWGR